MKIVGKFDKWDASLTFASPDETTGVLTITIQAASVDTGSSMKNNKLKSKDFFDVEHHPQVRFVSETAALENTRLTVRGLLHAAGRSIPLELDATVHNVEGGVEIEAATRAPHHELGMTWSPLGIARPHSTLIVKGRLVRV